MATITIQFAVYGTPVAGADAIFAVGEPRGAATSSWLRANRTLPTSTLMSISAISLSHSFAVGSVTSGANMTVRCVTVEQD